MGIAFFVIVSVFVLFVLSGAYVFLTACMRRKETRWLVEAETQKTTVGKYYECMRDTDEWLEKHQAQEVCVKSNDNLILQGLFVQNPNAIGTVILAHGYRSTFLLDFSVALPCFYELGFNLLIPNQRAHGKSQGKFITFGVKESDDMVLWIDFHNRQIGNCPVFLFGISMGASTMLYLTDRDLPSNVRGIVADCGFTSPYAIIHSVFKGVTHLPGKITMFVADIFARLFAGFSLHQKDTRRVLTGSKLPVLMIHGTKDSFVPCKMTEEGFFFCSEPKQILLIDGAEHGVSFLKDSDRYMKTVKEFINKYI